MSALLYRHLRKPMLHLLNKNSKSLTLSLFPKYQYFSTRFSSEEVNKSILSNNGIQNLSRFISKKRTGKGLKNNVPKEGHWGTIAYAAADDINLEKLFEGLVTQGLYVANQLPDDVDDVLKITAKYKVSEEHREIYIFREGCVVFWNVLEMERVSFLTFIKPYAENLYDDCLVNNETEVMEYSYAENGPRLTKGKFYLKSGSVSSDLTKYTFSNGLALSVKLGIWENTLDQFVESIEEIAEDLKLGRPIRLNRDQVLKKMGELFSLRHIINLSSDLLDTPDFYWEREDLEPLFQKTCSYFSMAKRTRVLNEKLNHCQELMQLLDDHLTDKHHVRLEIMIIALITIEVIFEVVHWLT